MLFLRRVSALPAASLAAVVLRASAVVGLLLSSLLLVSGCTHTGQVEPPVAGLALAGRVQGGQQPVTGAIIQLYAVGTTADASPATPLLTQTVFTDAAGSFSITGDYKCPSSTALVYLTATQGNPGLSAGSTNPNLAMMAALGACGQLSASTYIFVDEVTTVGTVAALYPYMTGYQTTGSGNADLNAFTTAFGTVNEFTNTANGTAPGPALPSGYYASSAEIDTLGNILAPCVNSTGGTAGDGSLCGQLFQLAKPATGAAPTDTVAAILDILKNPTQNVAALFNLSPAAPPFMPALTSAPSDWTLTIVQVPATPTFSLAAGTYTGAQTVSLSDSVAGASIYYTLDGTTPTKASTLYSGAFTIASSETVKALAIDGGRSSSAVASAAYTITTASSGTPVISSVSAVAAQQTQTISITGSGFGTKAAYTGTSNFISFRDATAGFQAGYGADSVTLVVSSWTDSQIVLGGFAGAYGGGYSLGAGDQIQLNIFNPQTGSGPGACNNIFVGQGATTCTAVAPTATPVFSPAGGSYSSTQTVTLTDATSGAPIYYTTDGSTPTSTSTVYSGPISVASSKVLKAYAFAFGYSASAVATAIYNIGTSAGIISTFAGTGTASSTGDGGQAAAATLNMPNGIACDASGNVYISEEHGIRVRKVNTSGIISTFAGTGVQGYSGDNGPATSAGLVLPEGLAVDTAGNVYIADAYGNRIRKVNTSGIITTFAGNGNGGYNGDGLQATATTLNTPYAVVADTSGNVYISDTYNNRVRKVNTSGVVSTYAGNGNGTFAGDGGQATSASISAALGITFDSAGNLYIADQSNFRVRKVTTAGVISTVAGNGIQGYTGDGGQATAAELRIPEGVLTDALGNLYIGDGANYVIRKVTYNTAVQAASPTFSPAAGTYTSSQTVTISSATSGATIYYTLDGTTPTTASSVYSAPLVVSASETIDAVAVLTGNANSAVASAAYTITLPSVATPTFSPAGGTYTTAQTVTLADTTAGAAIYYTLDGSTPTTASARYTVPLTITSSATVSAIAAATGYSNSTAAAASYVINTAVVAAPTFSPAGGTYTSVQTVTLASTTPAASIYYTLDGSNPTTSSTKYTGPITVAASETINAIAAAASYTTSAPSSATYTINLPATATPNYSSSSATPGTYYGTQAVLFSDATPNAVFYYTTDGSTPTTSSATANAGVQVTVSETVKVIAVAPNYAPSAVLSGTYTLALNPPILGASQDVSDFDISLTSNPGANTYAQPTFYYTIDGSIPSATNGSQYRSVFQVQPNAGPITVRAISVLTGYTTSAVVSTTVQFPTASAPVISPSGGTFTSPVSVSMSTASAGAKIMYTTDGTSPTPTHGSVYSAPITVSSTEVITAIAVTGTTYYTSSAATLANFTVNLAPAAAPFMSPYPGTFDAAQNITLTTTTPGATIYYTSDGSVPTTASQPYTAPISLPASRTLNAIAIAPGFSSSAVASGVYTIQGGTVLANFANGFPNGSLTSTNGAGFLYPTISGGVVQLENNSSSSWGALYYPTKLPVTNFDTSFDFEDVNALADGLVFVIQNAGSNALGGGGGAIGFGPGGTGNYTNGIPTSVGLKFDLYNNVGEGTDSTGVFLDGAQPYTPSVDMTSSGVILNSSHLLHAHVTYDGTNLLLTLQDSVTGAIFTHTFPVDIPGTVGGNIAYVGFTSASGAYNATQTLYKWTYSSTSQVAATPALSLAAGTYTTAQSLALGTTTAGAAIYYTLNGTTPTASSTLYTGPITVNATETVKAVAVASGYLNSDIGAAAYTVTLPTAATPTFSPAGGSYTGAQTVTISSTTPISSPNAVIYYTTDGTTPTTSSTVYAGPITVAGSETVKAIVAGTYYNPSAVASATYTISVAPHIATVGSFISGKTQTVVITGSGFGNTGPTSATSAQFRLRDNTNVWEAGYSPTPDVVGVGFSSWTDTQIVFTGFVGSYGSQNWTINSNDNLTITIWNGSLSGACSTIYVGGGPSTCP